jgi:hypothetical protein
MARKWAHFHCPSDQTLYGISSKYFRTGDRTGGQGSVGRIPSSRGSQSQENCQVTNFAEFKVEVENESQFS